MKISGNYTIDAPRQQVWDALNNIDVLARVVPGCQRLEQTDENQFEGTVKIGIQTIRGTYSGRIRLEDVQPPQHYKLIAHGKSSNGIVDGSGTVDLEEQDGKTLLKYGGEAQIAGTLASVGQRLIEGAAKQMINQSLKALVEQIQKRAAGESDDADDTSDAATPDAATPSQATTEQSTVETPRRGVSASNGQPASKPVPASMIGQAATASVTAARAPRPASPASSSSPAASAPAQPPEPAPAAQASSFQPRAVTVPEHEQLKPEAVAFGMVQDFIGERPWMPWVIIAFLLGFILGGARSSL